MKERLLKIAPCAEFCSQLITAQAEPNVRIRIRGASIRVQTTETRMRTSSRRSRQEGTKPAKGRRLVIYRSIEVIAETCYTISTNLIWKCVAFR